MSPAAGRRWRLARTRTGPVPPSVRRFSERARRRRLRAAAPWAAGLAVLGLAGAGWWVVRDTGLFAVRAVQVSGTSLLTPFEVTAAAEVDLGTPLARVDTVGVRRRVAALPVVGSVEVERDWPRTVRVRVHERTPVAAVPRGQQYLWLDAAGVAFHSDGQPPGVPLVKLAAPGPEDPATRGALRVLAAMPAALADRVRELVVASSARITLAMRDGRTVVWGDSADSETKARLALGLLENAERTIDVSSVDVVSLRRGSTGPRAGG
ncbi:hypothetical protein GCM10010124_18230 [Pilimelia terevasa]|uniref:POTRA domain-containing protein n=1 Tax=Pilimelia terevasa TaxID=53372 RepID=A0A8J3BJG6_9ACTN|nr:FtsQ-type POTRA domain-containing protein [Pilimelia terevasa]GGK26031.1 hypothetical protein GCM10010124_18230 [Pilimelia terevasa]